MSRDDREQVRLAMTMAEDRRADFGATLRHAREKSGVTLQDLAVTTKISARVLEALERNDPSKLPGGIFSRAFVRAYAREVGLDPEATVASFVSAFPDESGADEMPSAASAVEAESFEHRRHAVKVAVWIAGVAVLAAVALFVYTARVRPGGRPPTPASVQPPAPAPAAQALPPARNPEPAPPSAPADTAGAVAGDASLAGVPPSPDQAEPSPDQAEPPPAPAPDARVVSAADAPPIASPSAQAPLLVALAVNDDCWFSISADGTRMPSRTARTGERLEFAVRRSITITAGNAGAVSMTLNGKPARPLGVAGQVVTSTITPAGYQALLR